MGKKIGLIFVGILLFSLSFISLVSAQDNTGGIFSKQGAEYMDSGIVINTQLYQDIKLEENFTVYMVPYESSGKTLDNSSVSCRFGIANDDGSRVLFLDDEDNDFLHIGDDEDTWVGTVPGEFLNETGEYLFSWDCQTSVRGGYFSGEIDVTLSGEAVDGKDIASRFVLVLFFGILIFFIYSATNKVNFDGWYKKLKSQYEHRNYVKIGLGSIAYQLMKNIWVIFYIIGFIIVIILMDIVYLFNIESIFEAMKGITSIYTWGFILVGLVFLSYLQEFFKGILEQIEEENWGGAENGKH